MKTIPRTITLVTALLLSAILASGAYAMTVTPGSGSVQVGSTTTIPVVLDQSPDNLIYANISVIISDPSVAQIDAISFPPFSNWIHYPLDNSSFPAGSVLFKEMTLSLSQSSFIPATTGLQLGTLTIEGLKPGTVSLTVNKAAIMYVTDANDNTATVYPDGGSGSLQVTGTATPTPTTTVPTTTVTTTPVTTQPTTQPTTTTTETSSPTTSPTTEPTTGPTTQPTTPVTTIPTTEPTTAPPEGPTGSVYLSTNPTGANIYIDGSSDPSGTTPAILILPVGTHHASLRLDGYKDVPVYFEVEQDMTTIIAPRTLVPGIGAMPETTTTQLTTTTYPTTISTTVPTYPVVTVTQPQGGLFGWLDPAKLIQRLTSFSSNYF